MSFSIIILLLTMQIIPHTITLFQLSIIISIENIIIWLI